MTLSDFIAHKGGDAELAREMGVSHWAVRSWRVGTRKPRPEQANRLVSLSGGEVTLAEIYAPAPDKEARDAA